MQLLIITQKVDSNDSVLGFFHRWIEEFARHVEQLTIICLEEGEHALPKNVDVLSLGKEKNASRIQYIFRFFTYIWQKRNTYTHVFVHMNPEYVVLGGLVWRLLNKKIALWYTHRAVNLKLRIATFFSHVVFTASEQSFNVASDKVHVLGHGIDLLQYEIEKYLDDSVFTVLHVGRITPIKQCEVLLQALVLLKERIPTVHIIFVGEGVTEEDAKYKEYLQVYIEKQKLSDKVTFMGNIPHAEVSKYYAVADCLVNTAPTGGLDKVALEAMASSVIALSSNESFLPYFGPFKGLLHFESGDAKGLADRIYRVATKKNNHGAIQAHLLSEVRKRASLDALIERILEYE